MVTGRRVDARGDRGPRRLSLPATGPLAGKRLVILVQNLPVPFDRRVWQEALALRDAGASVSVVCPGTPDFPAGRFSIEGIDVVRYPGVYEASGVIGYVREYGQSLWRMGRALAGLHREKRFDVIQYCNPPDLLFAVAWPYRLIARSRLIFDQHDLGPELVVAKKMRFGGLFVALARSWEWCAYRSAHHVIATNESYRALALRRGGKSRAQVSVVRSGPRQEWIKKAMPSTEWNNGRAYTVGYVGVIGKQEGIEYLLEAARILVHEHKLDVQFCLVGSGTDVDRLKQLSARMLLTEHVSFLGRLSDEDLRSVLMNSDVCVNPDEVNELNDKSTMNKIMEYMALGKPIVQFDVTEGRFSAQQASLYAQANDSGSLAEKLSTVLLDPDLARQMGQFGEQRFRDELCWEQQTPILVKAYTRVLGLHVPVRAPVPVTTEPQPDDYRN